jgi:hypothetical protein
MQLLTRNSHREQVNLGRVSGDPRMETMTVDYYLWSHALGLGREKKWEVGLDRK